MDRKIKTNSESSKGTDLGFLDYLWNLYRLSPRLYERLQDAANFIGSVLRENGIEYYELSGKVPLPVYTHCEVFGPPVKCEATGFESGYVSNIVIDTYELFKNDIDPEGSAFLYNSKCPSISKALFTKQPSITVSRNDVEQVKRSDGGEIEVKWKTFEFSEILVGNLENPKTVVFIHYDSFGGGSVDNGAAVAIALDRIAQLDLKEVLVVFSAPDELSNEDPYWGFGFRFFEREFKDVLEGADLIVAFDSVGLSPPILVRDRRSLGELLPLGDKSLLNKAVGITSDWDKLFQIYHSEVDTPDKVDSQEVAKSWELLESLLRRGPSLQQF